MRRRIQRTRQKRPTSPDGRSTGRLPGAYRSELQAFTTNVLFIYLYSYVGVSLYHPWIDRIIEGVNNFIIVPNREYLACRSCEVDLKAIFFNWGQNDSMHRICS